jgi:crossover junction endodeoxyribonuclease RusA
MTSSISLPFPPSTNRLWRVVDGRAILSKSYRDWIAAAGVELMAQRPKKHQGPVAVNIRVGMPDGRKRDLDNLQKACLDLLRRHGVIEEDHSGILRDLRISIGEGFVGARIEVRAA